MSDEQPIKRGIVCGPKNARKRQMAADLKENMTVAEEKLWGHLRNSRLAGLKFRRQQIIDGFIADFYCHDAALVVEVDGPIHDDRKEYDEIRDRIISARNMRVVRFTNDEVMNLIDNVLARIRDAAGS